MSTDPDFAAAAAQLTNGTDDLLALRLVFPSHGVSFGSYASEASTFFSDPSGANSIAFAGNEIDSIALEFERRQLVLPRGRSN